MKWQLWLASLCIGMLWAVSGCDFGANSSRDIRETGPTDMSVTTDMLIGAQYRGRTGEYAYDDLEWMFDETHFRIVAGQQGMPKDLADALLPAGTSGFRIDGRWSVEGEVLTMTDLAVDGMPVEQSPRTLRTMCTPVIRIQAADHQYKFARGTAATAWSQGKISEWPAGTTSVRGSVRFEKDVAGWLTVGYTGFNNEGKRLGGSATVRVYPEQRSPRATTQETRSSRLAQTGSGFATMQYMAIPPGDYLFYAMWQPPDPRVLDGEIVIEFSRLKLQSPFATRWVPVTDRPLSGLDLDITSITRSTIEIELPASEAYQSVFALPWPETDAAVPHMGDQKAWELAWAVKKLVLW